MGVVHVEDLPAWRYAPRRPQRHADGAHDNVVSVAQYRERQASAIAEVRRAVGLLEVAR